jgi:hypothetical protein
MSVGWLKLVGCDGTLASCILRRSNRRGWRDGVQKFQRTGGRTDLAGGDQQILSRGAQIAMAEQQLNGAQIGACLQQVDSEGVP